MLGEKEFRAVLDGKDIVVRTGGFAEQAGGAVTVQQGDSLLLATATMGENPREGINFLPLSVDFEERMYAGGRIPGSFFRREGRPTEVAILTARLTDRPIRPLFPKDLRNELQVIIYAISSDGETQLDVLAIVGASAALSISGIPFAGPVAAVRVSLKDDEFIFNPTFEESEESTLDLRLAGTKDAVLMVECAANEVGEEKMVEALAAGHEAMQPLIELQEKMKAELGKDLREYQSVGVDDETAEVVTGAVGSKLDDLLKDGMKKQEFHDATNVLEDEILGGLIEEDPDHEADYKKVFNDLLKQKVRDVILESGKRLDGRGTDDLRQISAEVDLSPRAHGSGLFARGETQVLTLATLGTPRERQELDNLTPINEKRYIHHYNFPPFSVGEARFLRGASRREIGHGALAERALVPVLPDEEEFPYTLRLVSEVLSSNGSTSMGSVCGSTLALMDTGVPIKAPVAGIAMGLVKGDDDYKVLTDIQGIEDAFGDMDFKVAGTREGITALQMDIKIKGITSEIMTEALAQAKTARLAILDVIEAAIAEPRKELKQHAPRMIIIKIDPEKIGAVIGQGGKTIRAIQDETGSKIDIQDDGTIFVAAADGEASDRAKEIIEGLIEEAELGRIYTGPVVRTTDFGAFVQILPNTDGMVHISQLDTEHVESVEAVVKVGDEITVMVTDITPDGKIRLSRQAVLEGWTPDEAREADRAIKSGGGGRGRGRGRGNRQRSRR